MRMPGIALPPLPEHLEDIRAAVAALTDYERRLLMPAIGNDNIRRNSERHAEIASRVDRERNRRRPDTRQLRLEGAA